MRIPRGCGTSLRERRVHAHVLAAGSALDAPRTSESKSPVPLSNASHPIAPPHSVPHSVVPQAASVQLASVVLTRAARSSRSWATPSTAPAPVSLEQTTRTRSTSARRWCEDGTMTAYSLAWVVARRHRRSACTRVFLWNHRSPLIRFCLLIAHSQPARRKHCAAATSMSSCACDRETPCLCSAVGCPSRH